MNARSVLTAVVAYGLLAGCAGSGTGTSSSAAAITTLDVLGSNLTLSVRGQTTQLTARATYSDSTTRDVTSQAAWSSSNAAVASVSTAGLVTALSTGSATIQASYQNRSGSKAVNVTLATDADWTFLGPVYTSSGASDVGINAIAVDPRDANLIYAATDRGLFVSRDMATTWTEVWTNPSANAILGELAQDPENLDRLFYAEQSSLFVSVDQGRTVTFVKDFSTEFVRSLLVDPLDNSRIFVGTQGPNNSGFFRSADNGATWDAHPFPYQVSGQTQFIPWWIGEDPTDGTLYVPTELSDHPQPYHPPAFRSDNHGDSWTDITGTLPWHGVSVVVPPVTHEVFFLTEGAGLFHSVDRGTTWTRLGDASFTLTLVQDPNNRSRFFGGDVVASVHNGGVYISVDGAHTFTPFGLDGHTCGSLALSGDSTRLFAGCYNGGIFMRRLDQSQSAASDR
jgi:Big-like domain-containing protein